MKRAEVSSRTLMSIIGIILIVAVFLFMLNAIINAGQKAKDATDSGVCKASIINAHNSKKIGPIQGAPEFSLNCPRKDIKISMDIVESGKIDQDKAHTIIAKKMAECWNMVGEGKIDPFSQWNDVEDKSLCLICYRFVFDQNLKNFIEDPKNKGKPPQDFAITNPLPFLMKSSYNNRSTYFKYLYGYDPHTGLTEEERSKLQTSIVDDNSLVLVRMYKPNEKSWTFAIVTGIAAGVLIVGGIVAAPFTSGGSLALVVVGAKIAGLTAAVIGTISLYNNGFGDCPDCDDGQGGIWMVPSTVNLYEQNIPYQDKDGNTKKKALCDIIVN